MTWEEAYPIIANEISMTISDRIHDTDHLKNALIAMVDLTSIGNGSEKGFGREAEVALLNEMYDLYKNGLRTYHYYDLRNKFVEDMNSFTVTYFGDLTNFVSSLNWTNNCIPREWADLTEEASRDTSGWNLCSIS